VEAGWWERNTVSGHTVLVWAASQNDPDKTYFMALELRDYKNNYLNYTPVDKSFIINMVAKMEMLEQDGYKYDTQIKGSYIQEGLR